MLRSLYLVNFLNIFSWQDTLNIFKIMKTLNLVDSDKSDIKYHIITTPFNMEAFKKLYPEVDVHKNNPTILFCN